MGIARCTVCGEEIKRFSNRYREHIGFITSFAKKKIILMTWAISSQQNASEMVFICEFNMWSLLLFLSVSLSLSLNSTISLGFYFDFFFSQLFHPFDRLICGFYRYLIFSVIVLMCACVYSTIGPENTYRSFPHSHSHSHWHDFTFDARTV